MSRRYKTSLQILRTKAVMPDRPYIVGTHELKTYTLQERITYYKTLAMHYLVEQAANIPNSGVSYDVRIQACESLIDKYTRQLGRNASDSIPEPKSSDERISNWLATYEQSKTDTDGKADSQIQGADTAQPDNTGQ